MRSLFAQETLLVAGGATDYAEAIEKQFGKVDIVSITPTTWNDASLGCAKHGGVYAQVLTPGAIVYAKINGLPVTFHVSDWGGVKLASECLR